MKNNNQTNNKKRKIMKILMIVSLVLPGIVLILHFIWKNSGSNEWKLAKDENGIKVWTLKTPGSCLKKVKVDMKLKSKLADILNLLEGDIGCGDLGIKDWKIFDKTEGQSFFSAYYSYKLDMPFPIGTREFVLLIHRSQDPKTKVVEVNVLAAPGKTHPIKNCERVVHLNDIYYLTPIATGEVELEMISDMDIGGAMPYFLKNLAAADVWCKNMQTVRDLLMKEKYKNAKNKYIVENNYNPALVN